MIQLRTNWPTVLPCQVTSPQAKVSLHRELPPAEVTVDGTDISFDVKKGFTINRPRPHHAGALFCVASLGNLRQSSTKYMLIYVHCECCLGLTLAPVVSDHNQEFSVNHQISITLLANCFFTSAALFFGHSVTSLGRQLTAEGRRHITAWSNTFKCY